MSEVVKCTIKQLPGLVNRQLKRLQRNVGKAQEKASREAVRIIRKRAPKAFGELRESVHAVEGPKTIVDAPHAAAVEEGSAPHTPNLEALIEWVKLRGMQGLRSTSQLKRLAGPTTFRQARSIQQLLKREIQNGPGGMFSPADSAKKVALAISRKIQKEGTKPHWFVRDSLVDIAGYMYVQIMGGIDK